MYEANDEVRIYIVPAEGAPAKGQEEGDAEEVGRRSWGIV